MTIGIGFLCSDGIVLCADKQVTSNSGFKFETQKITARYSPMGYTLVFTYAGIQDEGEIMFRKIHEATDTCGKNRLTHLVARPVLEQVFKDGYESDYSQGFESLIGLRFETTPLWLFKTSDKRVVDGASEYIGCGDSSALRYLSEFLLTGRMLSVGEAVVLGSYMVSVASRYVDGCSGGPDRVVLPSKGPLSEGTGGPYPNAKERFSYCEEEIGNALRELLFSGGTKKLIIQDTK